MTSLKNDDRHFRHLFKKSALGIKTPTKDDFIILDSPLGPESQADFLENQIIELGKVIGNVEKLDALYGFLKNGFSLPNLLYFLRTSTCFNHPALGKV